jgi:hypothetical protein
MKTFSFLLVVLFCLTTNIFSQVLLEENFDYTAGDLLTDHGWVAHDEAGTNPVTVVSPGLTFPGQPGSGIGNAAGLDNNNEDVHKLFTSVTSGAAYTSFMVQVTNSGEGHFLHYDTNPHTFDYRGRVWVSVTSLHAAFGLSFGSGGEVFTSFEYSFDVTYLLILKYEIVAGADNDSVSLYIFDAATPPPNIEPGTPTLGPLRTFGNSEINPGSVNLRQFTATEDIIVDGILVSSTWSGVVTDVINAEIINPVEFKLSQNYPNPFNPSTRITYNLPKASTVTLSIYNLLGQHIRTLVNSDQAAGHYEVEWNGSGNSGESIPSGVYVYKIKAGKFEQAKKLVLMK